jgi:ribosomal protein L7Ae-like RNA K-turn-binding protein
MNKLSGAIGMCYRSRNCVFGFDNALKCIKKKKSHLILVAEEASNDTKKRIYDKCKYYNVDIETLNMSEILEKLNLSMNIKIISINDINFKKLIKKHIKEIYKPL